MKINDKSIIKIPSPKNSNTKSKGGRRHKEPRVGGGCRDVAIGSRRPGIGGGRLDLMRRSMEDTRHEKYLLASMC